MFAVIEGYGALHGALGSDGFASTAHVARLLGAPVVLVVDCADAAQSTTSATGAPTSRATCAVEANRQSQGTSKSP